MVRPTPMTGANGPKVAFNSSTTIFPKFMLFFDVEKQRLELKLFFLKLVVLEVEFSLVEIFSFRTPLEMTAREILGRIILNSTYGKNQ